MIAEDITFCRGLIGKPWISGASGPEAFDCWGLLRFVFAARRGIDLPFFEGVETLGLAGVVEAARQQVPEWEPTLTPTHLCGVAMGGNRATVHVGLWLDEGGGGILHSFQGGGVVFQKPATIQQRGMQNFQYFKHRKP